MKYQLAGIQRVEYFAGNEEKAIGSVLRALSAWASQPTTAMRARR